MKNGNLQMQSIATRLNTWESNAANSSKQKLGGAVLVVEKLRVPIATLMGDAGFRALLSRAIALTYAEVPWLGTNREAEDPFNGFGRFEGQVRPHEISMAENILIANLLNLLSTFVGEALTLQFLREVWPNKQNLLRGAKDAKAN
jgi:hypothetical protein